MVVAGAVAAVAGGVATYASGKSAAKAQKKGAEAQAQQAADQIAEERRQFDLTRADYAPYRETGTRALGTLSSMYGVNPNGQTIDMTAAVKATPGYQFRVNEGTKAIERSAAARGMLGSGATMKSIGRYVSDYSSDEYNQFANRLAAMAGVGQTATAGTAAAGEAAVSGMGAARTQAGQAAVNAGNARASSYANTGSAINGTVNNLASMYLYQQGGGFSPPTPYSTPPYVMT